jgi:hypothetical protein
MNRLLLGAASGLLIYWALAEDDAPASDRMTRLRPFDHDGVADTPCVPAAYHVTNCAGRSEYVGHTMCLQRRLREHLRSGRIGRACRYQYRRASSKSNAARLERAYTLRFDPRQNLRKPT